jgi:hypothetical protein
MATTVQEVVTFHNLIGVIGDMESGKVYKTTAEANYVKNSSQKKFGSSSQAFQQSASATDLPYMLKESSSERKFTIKPNHKYYFSMWVMHRTSTNMKANAYLDSYAIYTGRGNTSLGTWTQHSIVFQTDSLTVSSSLKISCSNYPGNNAAMNIDGLMLIDLTEACGAGNEPSKEWCDSNLAFTTTTTTATATLTLKGGVYIGVSGTARKIKTEYIGVSGVARKIKRAYIGVNGVARQCLGS